MSNFTDTVVHTRTSGAVAGVQESFIFPIPRHIKKIKGVAIFHETANPTLAIQIKTKSGLVVGEFIPTQYYEYGPNTDMNKRYFELDLPNNSNELHFASRPFVTLVANNTIHITLILSDEE